MNLNLNPNLNFIESESEETPWIVIKSQQGSTTATTHPASSSRLSETGAAQNSPLNPAMVALSPSISLGLVTNDDQRISRLRFPQSAKCLHD